jgi:hypothetical protein
VGSIPTYGHGGSPVLVPRWKPGWAEKVHEETVHGIRDYTLRHRRIETPSGTLTSQERIDYPEYGAGQTVEPLIKTRDDYSTYLAYVREWAQCVEPEEAEDVLSMREEIGDEGVWVWWITHTFYQPFWVLRLVQDYLLDFHDAPDLMRRVMDVSRTINERSLSAFNASQCRVLITNVSGASTSIVSPSFFRRWVLPELKWLVATTRPGKFVGFHLTGKIRDILPVMMEARPHFLMRFESPRFGGDCTLRAAREVCGDGVCLVGGFDPHVFVLGTREEMRQEALRCVDEAAQGGGYILDCSDAIPEGSQLEDVRAAVVTAIERWSHAS